METLRFVRGVPAPPARVQQHGHVASAPAQVCASLGSRTGVPSAVEAAAAPAREPASYMLPQPLRMLWPRGGGESVEIEEADQGAAPLPERRKGNWVLKILKVKAMWAEEEAEVKGAEMEGDPKVENGDRCVGCGGDGESEGCDVSEVEEKKKVLFDRDSFSRLLRRVSLKEAQLYAKMSYLGSLAYTIPKIKPLNLLKYHGLQFVTSSLEKKTKSLNAEKDPMPVEDEKLEKGAIDSVEEEKSFGISPSTAYEIASSAASYLHSQTKGILPFSAANSENKDNSLEGDEGDVMDDISCLEVASLVATTSSVTAMVAGKEEMKQAVAKDLNSAQSSPCEWFICDDDKTTTRYIMIQGSESLASWQTNLLFEPIQFEGLDVLVHRGIYEAAKGIYEQMLPEVQDHLKSHGSSASFRFAGHSLGGSLSLLINLMLVIRGEVPPSSLLPVITFGAPCIMCGGDYLLQKMGLPQTHVQAIMMHRDIVPRAFSCNYPDHVAKILKAVNSKFRNHYCLKNQKLLYAPMGKLLILQPEEKFSPHHDLLPSGSGLYILGHTSPSFDNSSKLLQAAQFQFLNSPHPLEMLSDRAAYGSEGTIYRDHDMNAYLRSMHGVIRQELKQIRKAKRERRRRAWWPLVASQGTQVDVITGTANNSSQVRFMFSGVLHGGTETLKRFGRLVVSQHLHMFVVLLLPARWLLLGTLAIVKIR